MLETDTTDPIFYTNRITFTPARPGFAGELDIPMPANLVRHPAQLPLPLPTKEIASAGEAADTAAARAVFESYRSRLAEETRRRHDADLACFAQFLEAAGAAPQNPDFSSDSTAWAGIGWGLVAAFVEWQLGQGYAISSINVRLSTVKVYVKLATKARVIDGEAYALIKLVQGFRHRKGVRLDKTRKETRKGAKRARLSVSPPTRPRR
jgi:hypothetical protein